MSFLVTGHLSPITITRPVSRFTVDEKSQEQTRRLLMGDPFIFLFCLALVQASNLERSAPQTTQHRAALSSFPSLPSVKGMITTAKCVKVENVPKTFFAWWKRHLKVYHLIARTEYGLMVQILSGLITYLLLAIYCHNHYQEKVSIKRVRELRIKIQNELRDSRHKDSTASDFTVQGSNIVYAKT